MMNTNLNSGDHLLLFAVNVLMQLTTVTVIALSLSVFARRRPVLRHGILTVGLILTLLLPAIIVAGQSLGFRLFAMSPERSTRSTFDAARPAEPRADVAMPDLKLPADAFNMPVNVTPEIRQPVDGVSVRRRQS